MPRPSSGNTRVNFLVNPKTLDKLKKIARYYHTTYSDLMRDACDEHAERLLLKMRDEAAAKRAARERGKG